MSGERWMTVQAVILELVVRWETMPNEATVRRWCKRGLMPGATRTNSGWKIPRAGLLMFLKSRTPCDLPDGT